MQQEPSCSLKEFTLDTGYTSSEVALLENLDLSTHLARDFKINIPFVSAAMQSVSGPFLAAELARCGGLGVIYCSQPIKSQAEMVDAVKRAPVVNGMGYFDYPFKTLKDEDGNLKVGAAINTKDYKERVPVLIEAGADILFIDSSHGNTGFQRNALSHLAENYPDLPRVGGNVINERGIYNLIRWQANGAKCGMGIGSICTTTQVKATGKGQATTIIDCVDARTKYELSNRVFPIIADGGIENSKDMCIALALGADALMLGRYFAGFDESPTRKIDVNEFLSEFKELEGKIDSNIEYVKPYWGEGSAKARKFSEEAGSRYDGSTFEEGVSGFVPFAGNLRGGLRVTLLQLIKSIKDTGYSSLEEFKKQGRERVMRASPVALADAGVHDLLASSGNK